MHQRVTTAEHNIYRSSRSGTVRSYSLSDSYCWLTLRIDCSSALPVLNPYGKNWLMSFHQWQTHQHPGHVAPIWDILPGTPSVLSHHRLLTAAHTHLQVFSTANALHEKFHHSQVTQQSQSCTFHCPIQSRVVTTRIVQWFLFNPAKCYTAFGQSLCSSPPWAFSSAAPERPFTNLADVPVIDVQEISVKVLRQLFTFLGPIRQDPSWSRVRRWSGHSPWT